MAEAPHFLLKSGLAPFVWQERKIDTAQLGDRAMLDVA